MYHALLYFCPLCHHPSSDGLNLSVIKATFFFTDLISACATAAHNDVVDIEDNMLFDQLL